jgi:hypothetical protein
MAFFIILHHEKVVLYLICDCYTFFTACGEELIDIPNEGVNNESISETLATSADSITQMKVKSLNDNTSKSDKALENILYTLYNPGMFAINLSSSFKIQKMYDDNSPDFCDHSLVTQDGFEVIELHSLNKSRFEYEDIKNLYEAALLNSELHITYKIQKSNWFLISGKEKDNIVYWKCVTGENFISDLHIEYPISRKSEIEPYIGQIARSFISK